MAEDTIFEEKQYLGRNRQMLVIRTVLAVFCFAAYYWSRQREVAGDLFLVLGIFILVLSTVLTFLIHFRTKVFPTSIELMQFFQIRKVKIPIKNLREVEVLDYERFKINIPVFNLHLKGQIHFFTTGNQVIRLKDKDGLVYLIGSQQPDQLAEVIRSQMSKLEV